jgi:hypothetical protein
LGLESTKSMKTCLISSIEVIVIFTAVISPEIPLILASILAVCSRVYAMGAEICSLRSNSSMISAMEPVRYKIGALIP